MNKKWTGGGRQCCSWSGYIRFPPLSCHIFLSWVVYNLCGGSHGCWGACPFSSFFLGSCWIVCELLCCCVVDLVAKAGPVVATRGSRKTPSFTLLEPQSRFGDKLLEIWVDCPQNEIAVLKGLTLGKIVTRKGCVIFMWTLKTFMIHDVCTAWFSCR